MSSNSFSNHSDLFCKGENTFLRFYDFKPENDRIEFYIESECILDNIKSVYKVIIEHKSNSRLFFLVLNSFNGNPWLAIFEPKEKKCSVICIKEFEIYISKIGKSIPIIIDFLIHFEIPFEPFGREFLITKEKDLISRNCIIRSEKFKQYDTIPVNIKHFVFDEEGELLYFIPISDHYKVYDFKTKEKLYDFEFDSNEAIPFFIKPNLVQIKKKLYWLHFTKEKVIKIQIDDYNNSYCYLSFKNDILLKIDFETPFNSNSPFRCTIFSRDFSKFEFEMKKHLFIPNRYDLEKVYLLHNYDSQIHIIANSSRQILKKAIV